MCPLPRRPDAPARHRPWSDRVTTATLTALSWLLGGGPTSWARWLLLVLPLISWGLDHHPADFGFGHPGAWTTAPDGAATGSEHPAAGSR